MSGVRVRVVSEPCDQCPFKGRLAGGLARGRLRDIREQVKEDEGVFICHKTMLEYGDDYSDRAVADERELGPAVCAGWEEIGDAPPALKLAYALRLVREVPPPAA